jgi:hypothetical protein
MSTQHLQLKPHKIRGTATAWWYEEEKGISIVQEHWEAAVHISTDSTTIPWQAIRDALARKDKP